MTVTCPTCKASLNLPDDRLPKGKGVTFACPHCKGKVSIDPAGNVADPVGAAAAAPAGNPAEAPMSYGEQRDPLALVCIEDPVERGQIMAALKMHSYSPRTAANAEDAVQRMRFTAYSLLVLREGYGGGGNSVLKYVAEMPMATRRLMHVILVSSTVPSHDAAYAFANSVNLVLNVNDLPHLLEALKRSLDETEQCQRVLLESLRALGKA